MLVPVIHFPNGMCAQAHILYQKAFGMTVNNIAYYKDAPPDYVDDPLTKDTKDLIMHSECIIYKTRINMSDGSGNNAGDMIGFNIFLKSEEDVRNAFNVLKDDGGSVDSELQPQFWTTLHGNVTDRFGINWQIMTE